ncbi:MAG: pentapeptide repeat-containing protein [Magnetococcales bacterium]|nr:pentapeptide repeat-containing protein [Magnetococcales bacterium]
MKSLKNGNKNDRKIAIASLGPSVVYGVIIFLMESWPEWLTWSLWEKNHDAARSAGLVFVGLVGLALLAWRTWSANKSAIAATKQAEVAVKQIELTRKGNLNDRFGKAAELLGSDQPAVRISGAHVMEQLAEEDPKTYHSLVMKILADFVRSNAPWQPRAETESKTQNGDRGDSVGTQSNHGPPHDIQSLVETLCRVNGSREQTEYSIDLSGTDLREANLSQVKLTGATLSRTNLTKADLCGADFRWAKLRYVKLSEALLLNTNFSGSSLEEAEFIGAHLNSAQFNGAHLSGAKFSFAKLIGADFDGADMTGASLIHTDLSETKGLTLKDIKSATTDHNTTPPGYLNLEWQEGIGWVQKEPGEKTE